MHKLMHSHLSYCCILFCILSLSHATAIPFHTSTDTNPDLVAPTATNVSFDFPDLPDDNFHVSVEFQRGAVLPAIAFVMVAVTAMSELALLDFGDACPPKTFSRDDYPEVSLYVGNPREILTPRWGLFLIALAIKDMMTHNRFWISQYQATYNVLGSNPRVAVVRFFARTGIETTAAANHTKPAVPQISGAPSTADRSTDTFFTDASDSKIDFGSNNDEMAALVTYSSKEISPADMFMAILWTLLTLAKHGNEERVIITANTCAAITASVRTYFKRVAGGRTRLQLLYGNLVPLMAKLPEMLLQENKFREMDIVITDQDVAVGKGMVRSTALSGIMGVPLTTNISGS